MSASYRRHVSVSYVNGARGFSLIEIMVALAILAGLTLLTSQAIKSAMDNRAMISREINRDAKIADALRIMRDDISRAFHHRDVFTRVWNESLPPAPTPDPTTGVAPQVAPGPTPRKAPEQVTGFLGDGDSLFFTALANRRSVRDSREGDQAKIGYFLQSCTAPNAKAASNCLIRSVSPHIDKDLDKPGEETVLLENITEFNLRYFGPKRDDFISQWKTGRDGDEISKENFPYAVEITLTMHDKNDPKERAVSQTVLAPIHFPNNPPEKKQPANGQGADPNQPPPVGGPPPGGVGP